ncbi:Endonuclease/exonuclease/phosphatase, partial [Earliella scabrosa]
MFHNVNHNNAHTSSTLETFASSCDVLCIQEPWHGRLKPVASTADVGPHERVIEGFLHGTVIHPNWQLLTPGFDARVACYVNRRLVNAISRLHAAVSHRDCMLLSLTLRADADPVQILNVYNDTRGEAVRYLHRVLQDLPAIDCMGGDFNTHATLWDPGYSEDGAERIHNVTSLFDNLGLSILNTPGVATHYPHNSTLRPTVIDLVAVPAGTRTSPLDVLTDDMGMSDHAPLRVSLHTALWSTHGDPTIPAGSEEEKLFLDDVRKNTEFISADVISDIPSLRERVDQLFAAIASAWETHARPRRFSHKSNTWWNDDCTEARDHYRLAVNESRVIARHFPRGADLAERIRHAGLLHAARDCAGLARRVYLSTLRAAKRKFFDERIAAVAEAKKRVWDLMSWTRPRALPMYSAIIHAGQPVRT